MAPAFDPTPRPHPYVRRVRAGVGAFFTGSGLPVFLAAATLVYELFLMLVIFAPPSWGAWSAFSEEFKIWCFSYDPRTGGMEWMSVVIMVAEPVFIVGVLIFVWSFGRKQKGGEAPRPLRRHRAAAVGGLLVGLAVSGGLFAYGRPGEAEATMPPFPGERIRTQITPPAFALADHRGAPVASADLRGKVTLVTGVYALCSTTCPEILMQVAELLETLPPRARAGLQVMAFSLNPEYDTAELMGAVAEAYGFVYPEFRYLNGEAEEIRPVLRDFQFSPRRNPETGIVDHANLFVLVDAEGRVAYRFNLDRRHRGWLRDAALSLLEEVPAAPRP